MLFDHTMAELTVLNAQERAKAKKLSVLDGETIGESLSLDEMVKLNKENEDDETNENAEGEGTNSTPKAKVMAKKTPRKLPLFMQRPIPETNEDIAKENFRVFVKWALSLIQTNKKLVDLGAPKFVCVNLPKTLQFVIDATNVEEVENGLPFMRFDLADENEDLAQNLELFGGLYGNNWQPSAKF